MVSYTTGVMHLPIPDDTDPWALLPETIRNMAAALDLYVGTLKPLALVSRTSDQSIPDGADTVIQWQSEDVDTLGAVNLAANNDRVTIPAGGSAAYACVIRGHWNSGGTAVARGVGITLNGSKAAEHMGPAGTGTIVSSMSTACVLPLSAGDIIRGTAFQNSGGAANLGTGHIGTSLLVIRL